ncbi:VacJ family lipoprotein [Orrella sp. JC864]|uniref:MlaA family lipoprotein n=1 Tax=Orrella sp. JC864 TaxID=3120298 RepID=UPI00300B9AF9
MPARTLYPGPPAVACFIRTTVLAAGLLCLSACAGNAAKEPPAAADAGQGNQAHHAGHINDPWERYNRAMYQFNAKVDKYVARPIGVAYDKVVPDAVQHRVTAFFANLQEPRTLVNQLLQGRPVGAARTLGRFVVNTTVGVAGIFDPASGMALPRANEDLGQTLAVWGWEDSRFFVAPLQGPRTLRDFVGGFGDKPLNPTGYIEDGGVGMAVTAVRMGSMRAAAFPADRMRAEALDEYTFVRDAWMQRRRHQIEQRQ